MGSYKILFIKKARQAFVIAGAIQVEASIRDATNSANILKKQVKWGKGEFTVKFSGLVPLIVTNIDEPLVATDGFFSCSNPHQMRLNRPSSIDLGRRFEYGEGPVPIVSAFGIVEMDIASPFWDKRWKQHEAILLSHQDGRFFKVSDNPLRYDLPKLAYCCLGMYAWRSTYTSEKVDALLQLVLVNFLVTARMMRWRLQRFAMQLSHFRRMIRCLRTRCQWHG